MLLWANSNLTGIDFASRKWVLTILLGMSFHLRWYPTEKKEAPFPVEEQKRQLHEM